MAQRLGLIALVWLIVLAGCAERMNAPTATSAPTVNPQLIGAECPRPALENWLQRSSNLTQELAETVNNNVAIQPERASDVIDQLGSIQAALEAARPPQCAMLHAEALNEALSLADAYFSAYRQGLATDPVGSLTRINSTLDRARALEQELMRLYDTLP
jgi:hypothetical protein